MKIEYDGRTWDFELEKMTVPQCEAVEKYVGKGLGEWSNQMQAGSIKAVIALWWVLRAQAGENPGPVDQPGDGFLPVMLLVALHKAEAAEQAAEAAALEAAKAAGPDPTPSPAPSSPGPGGTTTTLAGAALSLSPPG